MIKIHYDGAATNGGGNTRSTRNRRPPTNTTRTGSGSFPNF
jgi:hypothetical protein